MKKYLRMLALLSAALCLVFGFAALAGCDTSAKKKDDDTRTYRWVVDVSCDNGAVFLPAAGIQVLFRGDDGEIEYLPLQREPIELTTEWRVNSVELVDNSGTLSKLHLTCERVFLNTWDDVNYAHLDVLPESTTEETVIYSVVLTYPDGTPVANQIVQLCTAAVEGVPGACHPLATDENGMAVFELEADTYELHIEGVPDGYTFDNTKYTLTAENPSITVSLETAA